MQERPERWLEFYEDIRHRGSLRVTVNGTEYGEEDIVSCKVDRHLSDSGPSAGNACAACLTLRIIPNDPIPRAACVRLYYRLELNSDVTKYLPKGTFFVNRRKQDGRVVELECYDSMLKSEQDFLQERFHFFFQHKYHCGAESSACKRYEQSQYNVQRIRHIISPLQMFFA